MNTAKKIFPDTTEEDAIEELLYETENPLNGLTIVTELSIGEGEKDKVTVDGGSIVTNYEKIKSIYLSDGRLILVIDGTTAMIIDKYDEAGNKIVKVKPKDE